MLLISVGTAPALAASGNEGLTLGEVRAHLFYEHSGVLSEDLIARQPRFNGWNTDEGEGDAREASRNLLVVATLVNPGEETWLAEPVTLRVTDEIDAEVKSRAFREMRVPARGTLQLPLWIDNAACLGTVTVSATFRGRTVSGTLDLICGT